MTHVRMSLFAIVWLIVAAAGCSHYVAPGRGADFSQVGLTHEGQKQATDFPMRQAFDRKPLARFPAAIAVARIQAPQYSSRTAQSWGDGAYSLVTTRDIEKPEQLKRLGQLPMISGIAPIGRLSLVGAPRFESDEQLRLAAAQHGADI